MSQQSRRSRRNRKKTVTKAKIVDRENEQLTFSRLLQFESNKRILAIQDTDGGMGKSLLLDTYRQQCFDKKIPVCLVDFDQLTDNTPLSIVQHVVTELNKKFPVDFAKFERMEIARKVGDLTSIYNYASVDGRVSLDGADLRNSSDVSVTGVYIDNVTIGQTKLTAEQKKDAELKSIAAFYDDLIHFCESNPLVILFDTYERCCGMPGNNPNYDVEKWEIIEDWFYDSFLTQLCFSTDTLSTHKLLLVFAGREVPDFLGEFSETAQKIVELVEELSPWKRHHIVEYLDHIGMEYVDKHVDTFYHLFELGLPLLDIIYNIQKAKKKQDRIKEMQNQND